MYLGAEKLFAAQKGTEKIIVEVKSLLRASIVYEFHAVLGQFMSYQMNLEDAKSDRILYVAISQVAYNRMEKIPVLLKYIKRFNVKLIIFSIDNKEIIAWKK